MILLVANTDLLQLVTAAASSIKVHASYVDLSSTNVTTPGRTNTPAITTIATTTVVAGVAATSRTLKFISIYNAGVAQAVTLQHTDGTTVVPLLNGLTLPAGWTVQYNEGSGFELFDATGTLQAGVGTGRWLKRTVILNGTTAFVTTSATNSIIARMVAGGGGGGGAATTTGFHGSGGGGGSYAEWSVPVSPSTSYVVAVGAGGTGVSGGTGNTGGVTTFAVGGTTVTCNGGVGGLAGTSATVPVLGGAGGAISVNGTLNVAGSWGNPNTPSATVGYSGGGADSMLGSGGAPKLFASAVGNAATLYGAGGGGGVSVGSAQLGGAGSNGVIIVDEYS